MRHVRPKLSQFDAQSVERWLRPKRLDQQGSPRDGVDFVIVTGKDSNFMSARSQKFCFGLYDGIFTAALLIAVMNDQHSHVRLR